MRQEFLRHIGPEYESIIGSDIAGTEAKAQALDRANKGWKHLAERIATAVFVHSFTADEVGKGISLPYIKLAVLRSETIPSLVTEVLQLEEGELWYLNTKGDRCYFSSVPNLNRMVLDVKELVTAGVRREMERRIKRELGTKLRCILWPHSSDELANNRELKLAILDPQEPWEMAQLTEWLQRCGGSFRVYKNTLLFALPDPGRAARFENSVREYLALHQIQADIEADLRPGMGEKRAEVDRRLRDLDEQFPQEVRELYRTVAVPSAGGELERLDLGKPTIGKENLDSWYWQELTDEGQRRISTRPPSARMLRAKFLSNRDAISLADLLDQFYKEPGLPLLADPVLLAEGVAQGVEQGALGLGAGQADQLNPQSVKFNQAIDTATVQFSEDLFLLTPERAQAEQARGSAEASREISGVEAPPLADKQAASRGETGVSEAATEPALDDKVPSYTFRAKGIPASRIADFNQGVLKPLVKEAGNFTFAIEVRVESLGGISKRIIEQQVKETLRQLGAEIEEIEEGNP